MNKKVEDFIEEFTDNFSELFVESFIMRFTSEFKGEDITNCFLVTKNSFNKKIDIMLKEKISK